MWILNHTEMTLCRLPAPLLGVAHFFSSVFGFASFSMLSVSFMTIYIWLPMSNWASNSYTAIKRNWSAFSYPKYLFKTFSTHSDYDVNSLVIIQSFSLKHRKFFSVFSLKFRMIRKEIVFSEQMQQKYVQSASIKMLFVFYSQLNLIWRYIQIVFIKWFAKLCKCLAKMTPYWIDTMSNPN